MRAKKSAKATTKNSPPQKNKPNIKIKKPVARRDGQPVYLTKNGYGTMVVLSLEHYSALTDKIEAKLDEADRLATSSTEHLSHETVFANARELLKQHE